LVLVLALLAIGLHAGEAALPESAVAAVAEIAAPAGEAAAIKDGNALLDSLLTLFENLPVEKKVPEGEKKVSHSGIAEVDSRLSQLARDAKAALEAGQIDKIFFYRYKRMLTIYKMIITPVVKNELLENPFMKTFEDFVWDTTYERWSWDDKDSIAKMAAAMEEEFVEMKIYLDSRQKRAELKQKIGKRMLPPPPPPPGAKKKPEDNKPE
jgi:hypothetical protein